MSSSSSLPWPPSARRTRVGHRLKLPPRRGVAENSFGKAPDGVAPAEILLFAGDLAPALLAVASGESLPIADWPTAPGERRAVVFKRFDVYAPDARIWVAEQDGLREVPRSRLAFFQGLASADPNLRIVLAVDPDTRAFEGLAMAGDGRRFALRPWSAAGAGRHLLALAEAFNAEKSGETPAWSCAQQEARAIQPEPIHSIHSLLPGAPEAVKAITSLHTATLAVDTDNELLSLKFADNTTSATNYIATLIASMSVIYERDLLIRLIQGFTILRPSSMPDPYTQTGAGSADTAKLNEFSEYWRVNHNSVARAAVIMLSGKGGSNFSASGIAWLDALCEKGTVLGGVTAGGFSFNQVFKFSGSTAANDTDLVAHELGHNFGSPHTHCYSPPIDTCFNSEPGCYSGPASCPAPTTINGVPNVRGTLMSYCHLLGGCGAAGVFHPRSVDLIAPLIEAKVNVCIFPQSVGNVIFNDGFE
ncbi:MAG: zinc-dependent metalloprotease [Gammaproteobacteria bacterium]